MKLNTWSLFGLFTALIVFMACPALAAEAGEHAEHAHHGIDGASVAVWLAIPFAGILLSIAIMPLVAPHFWHHNFGKVSAGWAILGALFLFLNFSAGDVVYEIAHIILLDYVPFIILLLGLFVIAGGIRIKGTLRGSPKLNVLMLLIGTVLASWMGTTGAAMLMIRPLIKANAWRKRKVHLVVFFIFLVCNVGGSLTPLGDPPLFLGFLRGVEFTWTFHLLPNMAMISAILLAVFFIFDTLMLSKEEHKTPPADEGSDPSKQEKLGIEGGVNFLLLGGLIGAILLSSTLAKGSLYDQEIADTFAERIETGEKRQIALKKVLDGGADKFSEAEAHYAEAVAMSAKLAPFEAAHHDEHGDEGHGAHDEEEGHAEEHHGPFHIAKGRVEGGEEAYVGDLAHRYEMVQKSDGSAFEKMRPYILLDYQHAVQLTNGYRAKQAHDATKGLHLPAGLPTVPWANLLRDGIILVLALISWVVTSRESRKLNGFSWFPIVEVAKLFAGIFICIIPALKILQAGVDGALASVVDMVTGPTGNPINGMYFWLTGGLSSFLDNAPTYLVFFNTAGGDPTYLMSPEGGFTTLLAISCGAVFMGANTYIGNAPNFMVKSIAEESDIKMPSFFGYMLWSVAFLVPLFVLVQILNF